MWTILHTPGGDLDSCIGHTCIRIGHIYRCGVGLLKFAEGLERLVKGEQGVGIYGKRF